MAEPRSKEQAGSSATKALVIRVSESLRAQLDILALLNNHTVSDEIRVALEAWVDKARSDPNTQRRAESVRQQIEHEAATKRAAIAAIFIQDSKPTRSGSTKR